MAITPRNWVGIHIPNMEAFISNVSYSVKLFCNPLIPVVYSEHGTIYMNVDIACKQNLRIACTVRKQHDTLWSANAQAYLNRKTML
jgi:hypothetical protein